MQLPLYQIDAFTGSVFKGNPAAVMPLETWLEDGILQAIATENNLSETAFFRPTEEDGAFELRWFTPSVEVPLCGHATLASAFVLMTEMYQGLDHVAFETRSGRLTVRRDDDRYAMNFPAMNLQSTHRPERVIAAVGAAPAMVLKSDNWLLIYDSEDEVATLDVDVSALASALAENDADAGVICTAPAANGRADFVSRYFAPCHGISEDPVTGSTHCSLVPYWSERLGRRELHALQISARGGELFCRDQGRRVEISGKAVKYMEGVAHIPASP
ncbi:MAG: PhzF family phenazine biosynthesis protein [Gemmatimonadetes bacterium]|nr:PhzF family phenazine biosynthesis protein [Gemmatimonadota bacterium]